MLYDPFYTFPLKEMFLFFLQFEPKVVKPSTGPKRPLKLPVPLFNSTRASLPKCRTAGVSYNEVLLLFFTNLFLLCQWVAMICISKRSLLWPLGSPIDSQKSYQTANKAFGIFSGAALRCCQVLFIAKSVGCCRHCALFLFTPLFHCSWWH